MNGLQMGALIVLGLLVILFIGAGIVELGSQAFKALSGTLRDAVSLKWSMGLGILAGLITAAASGNIAFAIGTAFVCFLIFAVSAGW